MDAIDRANKAAENTEGPVFRKKLDSQQLLRVFDSDSDVHSFYGFDFESDSEADEEIQCEVTKVNQQYEPTQESETSFNFSDNDWCESYRPSSEWLHFNEQYST